MHSLLVLMHIFFVVIEFAIVLGLLVLIHELGHFILAKLCGVRVETFSIGFGPRIFGFQYGDTDYRISLLPLGGFVKMAGELGGDGNPVASDSTLHAGIQTLPPRHDDLTSKPRWQRVLIAVAGPVFNFVLAFFLLFLVAHYHHEVDKYLNGAAVVDYVPQGSPAAKDGLAAGDTITRFNRVINPTWDQIGHESELNLNRPIPLSFRHNGQIVNSTITVAVPPDTEFDPQDIFNVGLIPRMDPGPINVLSVAADSPASRAGLKPGDQFLTINGLRPHSVGALLAYLSDNKGATDTLGILRDGHPVTLTATPEKMATPGAGDEYRLGFSSRPPPSDIVRLPVGAALKESFDENRDDSMLVLRVVKGLFTRHVAANQLMGPVGIAQQIDIATQMGIWPLLDLVSAISLQLGILNLMPFPLLDGGMILFLIIESIMRRDVNQQLKEVVYQVAFVCIILFAFFILFNDITKLHLH
ncbi:MAG: RIP metalloprotease RseP [Acidobacteriaceae bacterium]